ncbi:hypothetical protein WJX72_006372 [[Myrmecia] bisecta]|uniref:ER transporter 6TM N-terminal domain-containing protein n=1 Tax=[Myrmecia] bisecta TaxID=41462 RepID=A0AAW1PP89_9CHLO
MGSKILAAAFVLGSTLFGAVLGGITLSLARLATNHGYTTLLCILGMLGLVPLAATRSSPDPAIANGFGILTTINFGTVLILGQFLWTNSSSPTEKFWNLLVSHIMLGSCLAAACIVVSATLVLPTLAGDEMHALLAECFRGIGKSVSGYGSRVFAPLDILVKTTGAASGRGEPSSGDDQGSQLGADTQQHIHKDQIAEEILLPIPKAVTTSSMRTALALKDPQHHMANAVQPQLEQARAALLMSGSEPAWLQSCALDIPKWVAVINNLDSFITRVAACEMMVDERRLLQRITPSTQHNQQLESLGPVFGAVFGQVATMCVLLEDVLSGTPRSSKATKLFRHNWPRMRQLLQAEIRTAMHAYAECMQHLLESEAHLHVDSVTVNGQQARSWGARSAVQLRTVAFATTLSSGIVNAAEKLETAVAEALACGPGQDPAHPDDADAKPRTMSDARRGAPTGVASGEKESTDPAHVVEMGGMPLSAGPKYELPRDHAASKKDATLQSAHPHIAASGRARAPTMSYYVGFLKKVLAVVACLPVLARLAEVVRCLPAAVTTSPATRSALLRSRAFQYGLKFWLACSAVLVTVIIVQQTHPAARTWNLQYPFVTVPIVFAERVEVTATKGFLRVAGTAVGGALGLLVMFDPALATKPVPLAVILVAFTFLSGCASTSQFKVAVVLMVIAFNTQILCQFVGCCSAHGTVRFFYTQLAGISAAVLLALLVSNLLLPWYASCRALDELGQAMRGGGQLLAQYYTALAEAVEASAAAARAPAESGGEGVATPAKLSSANGPLVRMGQHLSVVQTMLVKEQVAWTFRKLGIWTMPQIVPTLLFQLLPLRDRMTALELSVAQGPAITGAFRSSFMFDAFLQPLDSQLRRLVELAQAVTEAAAQVMQAHGASEASMMETVVQLRSLIADLAACRGVVREQYLDCRRTFHEGLHAASSPHGLIVGASDDIFRFQSWIFSLIKVMDSLSVVATTVADAGPLMRPKLMSWLVAEFTHPQNYGAVSSLFTASTRNIVGRHTPW